MAVSPVSSRMRRMQWIAIGLATAAIALNYVDRSTLAVGNIKIREEFGISATAIGALQSAWSITYALCQVPIGYFLDRLGPRWLVGVALVAVVAGAGGGRPRRVLCAVAVGARRSRRRRMSGISRRGARHQRLVPREGPRPSDRGVQLRRQYRSVHRAAAADRPDAGVRLADHVRHHGPRRRAGRAGVVRAVPRSGEDRTGTTGPGVFAANRAAEGKVERATGAAVPVPVDVGPDAGRERRRRRQCWPRAMPIWWRWRAN